MFIIKTRSGRRRYEVRLGPVGPRQFVISYYLLEFTIYNLLSVTIYLYLFRIYLYFTYIYYYFPTYFHFYYSFLLLIFEIYHLFQWLVHLSQMMPFGLSLSHLYKSFFSFYYPKHIFYYIYRK